MTTLWLLLAVWFGGMLGFFLFALMAMARNGERHESRALRDRTSMVGGRASTASAHW